MTLIHALRTDNSAVADIDARESADPRISLSREECQTEGNWAQTTEIKKEREGKLRVYRDGNRIRTTARSFYQHLRELAAAEPRKVRVPPKRFVKGKHHPTLTKATTATRRRKAHEGAATAAE